MTGVQAVRSSTHSTTLASYAAGLRAVRSNNTSGIQALVANGQGDAASAAQFVKVAGDWQNLWNSNVTDSGFSGFIQPRFLNGSFSFVDPRFCSPVLGHTSCFLNEQGGEFYEGTLPSRDMRSYSDADSVELGVQFLR